MAESANIVTSRGAQHDALPDQLTSNVRPKSRGHLVLLGQPTAATRGLLEGLESRGFACVVEDRPFEARPRPGVSAVIVDLSASTALVDGAAGTAAARKVDVDAALIAIGTSESALSSWRDRGATCFREPLDLDALCEFLDQRRAATARAAPSTSDDIEDSDSAPPSEIGRSTQEFENVQLAKRESSGAPSVQPEVQVPGMTLDEIERWAILKAFDAAGGSTAGAARLLGISVRKVQYRLQSYGRLTRRMLSSREANSTPPPSVESARDEESGEPSVR